MKTKHGWGRVKDGERYYHIIETDKGFEVYGRREGRYSVDENGFNNNNYNTEEKTLGGISDIFNMILAGVKHYETEHNTMIDYEKLHFQIRDIISGGVNNVDEIDEHIKHTIELYKKLRKFSDENGGLNIST
jgi:hypothetical protein